MRQRIAIAALVLLSACDHFQDDQQAAVAQTKQDAADIAQNNESDAQRIADTVRDNIKNTSEHIREWWITPLPGQKKQAVAASYCYHVLQDILCYRQPMSGWEYRLVGFQGTGAAPPPPAVMQPLAVLPKDPASLPANRVANAQPVFVDIPAPVKGDAKEPETGAPPTPDAAHEQLPDPALAPQL